jgi:hypothetical protein
MKEQKLLQTQKVTSTSKRKQGKRIIMVFFKEKRKRIWPSRPKFILARGVEKFLHLVLSNSKWTLSDASGWNKGSITFSEKRTRGPTYAQSKYNIQ